MQSGALNHWRWESLGWHGLPKGPQKLVLTREFPGEPPWQIFVDSVVLSRAADFDPQRQNPWVTVVATGEIASTRRQFQPGRRLPRGRYRWRVTLFDGDRLVDWRGHRGLTSQYAHFRVPE